MTALVTIAFPYPTSAAAAAQDVLRLQPELASEPDSVAVVSCDDGDAYHVTTNHAAGQEEHLFFWHLLLTALIFVPGSGSLTEAELAAFSRRLAELGLPESFQLGLREMLTPETSALLLLAEEVPVDVLAALGRFGGKVLAASLVHDAEDQLALALQETRTLRPQARKAAVPRARTRGDRAGS